MSEENELKQGLPFPYCHDLSQILRSLNRRTRRGRERIANDPVTAGYLAAAIRLVKRYLGPGAERAPAGPEDDPCLDRPLLRFLTQRAIAKEYAGNPHPFPRQGNVSTMRSTWQTHSHFIADLLRFGLWSRHFPAARRGEVTAAAAEALHGPEPARAIHEICYWDLVNLLDTPIFRLSLIAAASAEGDAVIQQATSELYGENTRSWAGFYEEFLRARHLRPRPGLTVKTCADILSAVADGLAARTLTHPEAQAVEHERRRSHLGTVTLALVLACLERDDEAGGQTLEEAVAAMLRGPSADAGGTEPGVTPAERDPAAR
jgi:hypothetical protein